MNYFNRFKSKQFQNKTINQKSSNIKINNNVFRDNQTIF